MQVNPTNYLLVGLKFLRYIGYCLQQYHIIRMEILEWVKRQTGKLADNVKDYKFYVKSQPNFIDSSTTLVLTSFNNRDQTHQIPCVYKWSKIKNGLLSQVQFKGNAFICQPSDIGSIIQAEVTSNDTNHPGTAVLRFGPVKLDVIIKKQIQHSLTTGSAVLNVDLLQKDKIKHCQIKITQQNIKIADCNSNNQYTFDYTIGQPRIQANIKQPEKVQIFFNEKYEDQVVKFTHSLFGSQEISMNSNQSSEKRLQLKFSSRAIKDNFLLIVKAFNTKRAMKTSAIITKIQNSNADISKNENFDYVLQIQSLRADLVKLARLNDKYLLDKKTYYQQARKLQKQIQQIIVTYTKIVQGKFKNQQDLDQSIVSLRQKRDQVLQNKLNSLIRQNHTLRQRIQQINGQMNKNSRYIGEQSIMTLNRNNSKKDEQSPNKADFSRKNMVAEAPIHNFDKILNNLNQQEAKNPAEQDKIFLAKKLNQSMAKVAKLEEKIKEMKINQTGILDNSQNSFFSVESSKKGNLTSHDIDPSQKQKFLQYIQQIRKENAKLKEQNVKIKSEFNNSRFQDKQDMRSQKSKVSNQRVKLQTTPTPNFRLQQDLKSQKSFVSNQSNKINAQHQMPKVGGNYSMTINNIPIYTSSTVKQSQSTQKELRKRIEQLDVENKNLRQQVSKLKSEKNEINNQKLAIQAKYKKKMSQLSSQNTLYKRSQDALNRSQNLHLQAQEYFQEQNERLKQQINRLQAQNLKLKASLSKAKEELKKYRSNQQNSSNLDLSLSKQNISMEKSIGQIKQ